MGISPVSFSNPSIIESASDKKNALSNRLPAEKQSNVRSGVAILQEQYRSESMLINYQTGDGDTLTLSTQSIDYQKQLALAAGTKDLSDEDWKKIIKEIKDEMLEMKKELVRTLVGSPDDKDKKNGETKKAEELREDETVADVPEYWNAENTSQRIVDFSLSFRDLFKGSDEEYYNIIKGAIEDGFKQARDILGDLPGSVNNLVNNTHDLAMQKLDQWLAGKTNGNGEEAKV